MNVRRSITIAAAVLALAPASASAANPLSLPASERLTIIPSNDVNLISPEVNRLIRIGKTFWEARNVHPVVPDHVMVADLAVYSVNDDNTLGARLDWLVYGAANIRLRSLWVDRGFYKEFVEGFDEPLDYSTRRQMCAVIVHEVGHLGGLLHTENGVMAPDAPVTPWECTKAYPRPKVRHRHKRS